MGKIRPSQGFTRMNTNNPTVYWFNMPVYPKFQSMCMCRPGYLILGNVGYLVYLIRIFKLILTILYIPKAKWSKHQHTRPKPVTGSEKYSFEKLKSWLKSEGEKWSRNGIRGWNNNRNGFLRGYLLFSSQFVSDSQCCAINQNYS